MNPRWNPAMQFALGGIEFRVRPGRKADGDLVLEWMTSEGWRAIPMSVGLMLNDFHYSVEDHLYPPPFYKGGRYWLEYVRHAVDHGWRKAWAGVEAAKSVKSLSSTPDLFDVVDREAS